MSNKKQPPGSEPAPLAPGEEYKAFNQLPTPVFTMKVKTAGVDSSLCISASNHSWSDLLNYSAEELTAMGGDFVSILIHKDDRFLINQMLWYLKSNGNQRDFRYLFRVVDKEGISHWIHCVTSVKEWHYSGAPYCLLSCAVVDFGEERCEKQEILRRFEKSRKKNRAKIEKINENDMELIGLLDAGKTLEQIGAVLYKSKSAVNCMKQNLIAKLGLENSDALMKFIWENALGVDVKLLPFTARKVRKSENMAI
jgi:hypothetical protein